MSRITKAVIAGLITGILWTVLSLTSVGLHLEEEMGLGLLFKLRGAMEAPSNVIIVNIDKVSSKRLNIPEDPEKWPRSLHARLIENLARKGASVIAFDIIFEEASSKEEDDRFAQSVGNAQNVVLGEVLKWETVPVTFKGGIRTSSLSIEKLVPPIDPLARSALALAPFPLPKVPVRVNQYWTFKKGAGDKPTLPVMVFQIYALGLYDDFILLMKKVSASQAERLPGDKNEIIRTKGVEKLIRVLRDAFQRNPSLAERMLEESRKTIRGPTGIKKRQILTSLIKMYQSPTSLYLNFYGPPGTIPTVCYYQVLNGQEKSNINQIDFNAKAVFVGLSERLRPEMKDGFYTVFSQPDGIDMSGVEIAATAFANLLEDRHVRPLGSHAQMAIMILWGILVGSLCYLFPAVISAGSIIGLGVICLVAAQYQFKQTGIWYPMVFPLFFQAPFAFFGTTLWRHFETNRERKNIRRAFGFFIPNEVVDQLAKNIADIRTSSRIVHGTCLFADAGQYTALSETMEPKELTDFMDKYYEVLFDPVKEHGGTVINVVGDAMLAVWTAPHPDATARNQACLAALEIADGVRQFNQSSGELALPIRMGLHSGQIVLGHVGALDHYEYRPTGDIVNTASRMEGLNKYLGTRILVSKEVLEQVDGFLTRDLGKIRPAGKSRAISVHELICRMEECEEKQKRHCENFTKALRAFKSRSWDEAIAIFQKSIRLLGQDGPSTFFINKCEEYKVNPPGETWDGVIDLEKK